MEDVRIVGNFCIWLIMSIALIAVKRLNDNISLLNPSHLALHKLLQCEPCQAAEDHIA